MSGDDDYDRPERERRSWKEIDQMRDGTHRSEERRPRGKAAEARADAASAHYRKQLDTMFSSAEGGAEGARLARAIRDAHGTPGLSGACRAYRDHVGYPGEPALVSLFLDSGESELVVGALEALKVAFDAGDLELGRGIQSQLRMCVEGPDNAVADLAEELLEGV